MIEVYGWDNKNYTMNGDITIQPSYAILKVELNGICEIELEHHYDKLGRWKYLKEDSVVSSPTPWSPKQLFRIYDTEKTLTGLKIYARHIYFDLVKSNIESNMHIKNKNGQQALEMILKDTEYTAHSDIVIINDCYFFKENVIEGISGTQENTFLKRWNGEIFLDNFDVYINKRIGGDYGVRISYANNLENLSLKRNMEDVFTRLQPYVIKNTTDTIELPEKYVDSPNINKFAKVYEKYIDLSEYMHLKEDDEDVENAYDTEQELYEAMRSKCRELFEEGLDKPSISGFVNMVLLENTIEYDNVKELVNIGLGDDIKVEHLDIEVETITRCVGYTWDAINKKYIDINLGELESDYFDIQSNTTNDLNNVLNDNGTLNSRKMQGIIDALKTQFSAMRDVAQPQEVRAMLFEDKIKGSATYGALAIGTMGLMIASERTPDDRDWNWRTFIGGGYAYADWLIGKLKTVLIENMDGSFSIDLNKPGGIRFFNDKKLAIEIRNNSLDFFNWGKTGDYIGSLIALCRGDDDFPNGDPDKPLIGLVHDLDSALSIGYVNKNGKYNPYIEFDYYGILNKDYSNFPIRIKKNIEMGNSILDFEDKEIYNSSSNDIVMKMINNKSFLIANSSGKIVYNFGMDRWLLKGIYYTSDGAVNADKMNVNGDLKVFGSKNRVVRTNHYGDLALNAVESTECWFGDIGRSKLINGKCILRLDPKFLETVNTDINYEVRTWAYGNGNVWVETKDMYPQYVIVKGTDDIEFGYEIIAKQKGYEDVRLEEVIKKE